jgi:apolipoprotein N-acyltransferase
VIRHSLSSFAARRPGLAAFGLGALSVLALPPLTIVPFLLLTVPGLLLLLDAAPTRRRAACLGFWFGFGNYLFGLYWITEAILVKAAEFWWLVPIAVPGVALILAPFTAAACLVASLARPGWRRALVLAGAWALADLARQYALTGFPWNPWGSVWELPGWAGNVLIQPAAWVGMPGLTFATVLLAATPALGRRAMAAGLVVLLLWIGGGALRLRGPAPKPQGVSVVLVQGDVAEGAKMDQSMAMAILERYLRLTREGVARAVAQPPPGAPRKIVVVWPESAYPFLLQADAEGRALIMQAAQPAVAGLIGSVRFTTPDGLFHSSTDRPRNSLIALAPGGRITGIYDKWHLVPGGEYQPSWLPLPVQLVPGGGFVPGPGPATLHLPDLPPVGPLICYEAIFPGEVVDEADRPDWMVNITNDAWFGDSSGPRQHLAAARMRAVEEGLPLMRAANTGISAGFDADGRELARLGLERMGSLVVNLPGALPPTVFARWGLKVPGLLALAALAIGFGMPRRRPGKAVNGKEREPETLN